jgi:hypothetical protein
MLANVYSDTTVQTRTSHNIATRWLHKRQRNAIALFVIEMFTRRRFENCNGTWHEISCFLLNSIIRLLYLLENSSSLYSNAENGQICLAQNQFFFPATLLTFVIGLNSRRQHRLLYRRHLQLKYRFSWHTHSNRPKQPQMTNEKR